MTWARLKIVSFMGTPMTDPNGQQQERLFNITQLQWWIGRGDKIVELQYASQAPVFVAIGDADMERLTGTSGGYAQG